MSSGRKGPQNAERSAVGRFLDEQRGGKGGSAGQRTLKSLNIHVLHGLTVAPPDQKIPTLTPEIQAAALLFPSFFTGSVLFLLKLFF